ncbi:hypothetical protein KJ966_20035, partial [bacterium]|nr:hypothetical protein [bacterium]
ITARPDIWQHFPSSFLWVDDLGWLTELSTDKCRYVNESFHKYRCRVNTDLGFYQFFWGC